MFSGRTECLRLFFHLLPGDVRQYHDKFISSCPEYIPGFKYFFERAGRVLQKPVAIFMSLRIVDFLEAVQVVEKDPHGFLLDRPEDF